MNLLSQHYPEEHLEMVALYLLQMNWTLTADITITGDAGSVVDLGKSIFEVSATGIDETFSNRIGSKNLITIRVI